jgi:hypothetical protein
MSRPRAAIADPPARRRVARRDEIPACFRPSRAILWDPWFVRRGEEYHAF